MKPATLSLEQASDLLNRGLFAACGTLCSVILRETPFNAEVHWVAAASALHTGAPETAIRHLKRAAALDSRDERFPLALGRMLLQSSRIFEALKWARRAFRLAPDRRDPQLLLATCLLLLRRHKQVIKLLGEPAGTDERHLLACAHALRGQSLMSRRQYVDAADAYMESLQLEPRQPAVLSNLGGAYCMAGNLEAARSYFRRAIACDPGFLAARSNLLLCMHYLYPSRPAALAREHQKQGRAWTEIAPQAPAVLTRIGRRRPRIGFLSSDMRRAPTARFIEPLLRYYDRCRFHTTCYYSAPVVDRYTLRLRELPDRWRPIHGLDDIEAVRLIRADGCDLLIDLNGHNHGNRLGVFALRAAPIQATYLGYPDTTGIATIDYRISDAICDPSPRAQRYCTERLIYMRGCFLCFQPVRQAPNVTHLPADRSGSFTFGSLNQLQKVSHGVIRLWAEILRAVPGAKLLMKSASLSDPQIVASIRRRFKLEGIQSERLDLRGRVPAERAHLATYGDIDLALDPFPYAGTTTTCEALWMGVPVLTLRGNCHAGRVGATLLHAVGMDEFVAAHASEYFRKAVSMANDWTHLRTIRDGMRARMRASTLCDQPAFARRFEEVLARMISS